MINFPSGTNGKSIILGVLILKHITVLANKVDPDQMPHYVASDPGLHCLPVNLLRFPGKNGLMQYQYFII